MIPSSHRPPGRRAVPYLVLLHQLLPGAKKKKILLNRVEGV